MGEAVRIRRRGLVLNSKGEYSRCKITRLSLEKKEDGVGGRQGDPEEVYGEPLDWSNKLLKVKRGQGGDSKITEE